jgi:hypothetical protein
MTRFFNTADKRPARAALSAKWPAANTQSAK